MKTIKILRLTQLPRDDLQPLLAESQKEGFKFLERLVLGYANGSNQFAEPGEALFGVYSELRLIAIGGLNRDPYLREEQVGRVRHVYVLPAWRTQGIGRLLVQRIINEAKRHYHLLTLRTVNDEADRFYRAIGFKSKPEIEQASHHLVLSA